MADEKVLQNKYESARLLLKVSVIGAICTAAYSFVILFAGIINKLVTFDSFSILVIPYTVTLVLFINSALTGYFESKAAEEEEDRAFLEKRKERLALDSSDDILYQFARTLKNYRRFSPIVIAIFVILFLIGTLYIFYIYWAKRIGPHAHTKVLECAFVTILLSLAALLGGIFINGQSRDRYFRSLRPAGAWLSLSSVLGLLAASGMICLKFEMPAWNDYASQIAFWILAVLVLELIINLTIEFYRPRTAAQERPVFESRILGLLSEPAGIIRNFTDTLEYQFGFKVSKGMLSVFIRSSLIPLILIWAAALWLFTCFVEVKSNELGIRELFGKRVEGKPLTPGLYLKLPWPLANIARFPVYEIREVVAIPMTSMKDADKNSNEIDASIVLWTKKHYKVEPRYVLPVDKEVTDIEAPVSFLAAYFPIQFSIKPEKLNDYAYQYRDPSDVLKSVSEREITRYLCGVDMLKLMCVDRFKTAGELKEIIQKAVDDLDLGINIVAVNFSDAHPPSEEVAPSFQEVVSALEEKETMIMNAKTYVNKIIPESESDARRIVLESETYSTGIVKIAEAEKERFGKQLEAYSLMPEMFRLRYYLDFFENDCRNVRKYVVSKTIPYNVFILNLEEKARLDLVDSDLVEISEPDKTAPPPPPPK